MTLNDLIRKAVDLSYQVSGGDVPLLYKGKEVDVDLNFLLDDNRVTVEIEILHKDSRKIKRND